MPDEAVIKETEILSKIELDRTIKDWLLKFWKRFQIFVHYCLLEYQQGEFICLNY